MKTGTITVRRQGLRQFSCCGVKAGAFHCYVEKVFGQLHSRCREGICFVMMELNGCMELMNFVLKKQ